MASGIIQLTLLLLAMGLALLPFFQFFRGTPHQLAAIKQLEESMPAELLEELTFQSLCQARANLSDV